jgi:hypothetical protein
MLQFALRQMSCGRGLPVLNRIAAFTQTPLVVTNWDGHYKYRRHRSEAPI